MNEWMASFMDLDAGAAGPRAGRKLEANGRRAFPVILNHMKVLDFSTEDGYRAGDMCQKTMERLTNGRNFDWRYSTSNEDIVFNKKVVKAWAKTWGQVVTDIEAWITLAKLAAKAPDEAAELRTLYGAGAGDDDADAGLDDDLDID